MSEGMIREYIFCSESQIPAMFSMLSRYKKNMNKYMLVE